MERKAVKKEKKKTKKGFNMFLVLKFRSGFYEKPTGKHSRKSPDTIIYKCT